MTGKSISFVLRGMLRDLSVSKFNPQYAYENMNLRFTVDKDNTLISIVNEKGPRELLLFNSDGLPVVVMGSFLGHNVLNNIITIFTKSFTDRIYRLVYDYDRDLFVATILFEGNLGFDPNYPIETLGLYENEDIQKVYWLDSINQPRVINVAESNDHTSYNENSFDFALKLLLNESISVTKNNSTVGVFAPGVIQYAFSYFNRYGQESSIFYTTPLNYISHSSRGGSPEDVVSNSFTISMNNLDDNFEYIRIYSILRTSLNAVPVCKKVVDLALQRGEAIQETFFRSQATYAVGTGDIGRVYLFRDNTRIPVFELSSTLSSDPITGDLIRTWIINFESSSDRIIVEDLNGTFSFVPTPMDPVTINRRTSNSGSSSISILSTQPGALNIYDCVISYDNIKAVSYTDNGTIGEDIAPTELLFKGSEEVTAGTFTHKDNTLFLGDIKILRQKIPQDLISRMQSSKILFNNELYGRNISQERDNGLYPYDILFQMNSSEIKTFKYLDWYRFGLLFLHRTGKWSEPVFVNDIKNNIPVNVSDDLKTVIIPSGITLIIDPSIITDLIALDYVRVRGVVVYPDLSDREVLAQGLLMPTIYNVQDRVDNSPFSMSSWFARPMCPYNLMWYQDTTVLDRDDNNFSRSSLISRSINTGTTMVEHRHNYPLAGMSTDRAGNTNRYSRSNEILAMWDPPSPYLASGVTPEVFTDKWREVFYVDQSILTFHSPDIEFDDYIKNINSSGLKLRIVGLTPLTGMASDIDITTSTSTSRNDFVGFINRSVNLNNITRHGGRILCTAGNWGDRVYETDRVAGFATYPWHRNGSLNNRDIPTGDETRESMLERKKLSNLRFSYNSVYYDEGSIWIADRRANGISGVLIFDSNESVLVKIPAQENSGLDEITYYGNVDKIVNYSRIDGKESGYPIVITYYDPANPQVLNMNYVFRQNLNGGLFVNSEFNDVPKYGTEPVSIKYKSSPHAVLALNYTEDGRLVILPTIEDNTFATRQVVDQVATSSGPVFFNPTAGNVSFLQDIMPSTIGDFNDILGFTNIGYAYFWLAELYNDLVFNRFGGSSEEAIENNIWYPAGEPIKLIDDSLAPKSSIDVIYSEGDTFYLRYDCLKTYPYTLEDLNSVVEIVSFMCETRTNIDGRYDRNRGLRNNLTMTPTNFNLFNPVYNLMNNYFNYRSISSNRLQPDSFKNIITWSTTKTLGELTDTWANITLASTLDMDGDKGPIRALRRFNNEIYAFQDKGVARVLFNSRVQINPSDGVPIEISNSYKVDGKVYIGLNVGCINKWSIVSTLNGIYFIDNLGKSIYHFNGNGFQSLSDAKGFRTFISELNSLQTWNNELFDNFITHYDSANKDIYFINKDIALVYSETLGEFTSFYSYEQVPLMFNAGYKNFMFKNNRLWEQWGGDYNNFFGQVKPFHTTVVVNPEQDKDKIFNTVEFRADTYDNYLLQHDKTFDYLEIWNEYQTGMTDLTLIFGKPSSLKKKYRIWRANIPRDTSNGRDRIRNTWAYLKLSMNNPGATKTELHDLSVAYIV